MRNDTQTMGGNTLSWKDFQKSFAAPYEKKFGKEIANAIGEDFMEQVLEKALQSTGTQAIAGVSTGGDATVMESLYDEVVSTELNMKDHATIWNDLQKVPVLEEYVQKTNMNSYGGGRRLGFINPGMASGGVVGKAPSLRRTGIPVRWVGGRYQTFTSLNSQRTIGLNSDPAVGNTEEINSETRLEQMILNANELCWHGDFDINALEPYGILQQIRAAWSRKKPTRINMNGMPIHRDFVPKLRQLLKATGGQWTHFYAAPTAYADLEMSMIADIRRTDGAPATLGMYPEEAIIRDLGGNKAISKLREDMFLETLGEEPIVGDDDAPIRPSAITATAADATQTNFWGTYTPTGVVTYSACAVGINGRSAVRAIAGTVTVGASKVVNVVITNADNGTVFFEVYKGTTAYNRVYLGRVSAEGISSGSTATFVDDGEWIEGTSTAVAMTIVPKRHAPSTHIAQLLPTTKVNLPNDLMAGEAGWICGFTPRVMNEEHNIVLENIGRYVS